MKKLKEYIDMPNSELLRNFKWGEQGSSLFYEFMKLVRNELELKEKYKESLDKIYKVTDSYEWHYKHEDTPEGYISKIVSDIWMED